METVAVAKIAVAAAPYSADRPFDYLIPEPLLPKAVPGVRVLVPFGRGNRRSEGVVLACGTGEKVPALKEIACVLDDEPVLDEAGIALALWMRQRYFCTMYEAVKAVLPAGLWYQFRETYRLTEGLARESAYAAAAEIPDAAPVLDAVVSHKGAVSAETLRETCGADVAETLRTLCSAKILTRETAAQRRVGDKTRRIAELAVSAEEALALAEPKKRTAPVRYAAVRLLAETGRAAVSDLCYFTGATMQTLRGLEKAGLLTFREEEQLRVPAVEAETPEEPITLNGEQQAAFDNVLRLTRTGKPEAVLLQGVTGSGKTQVYIRLVQEILANGKTAIVLVPEIVLTPQMMRRFSSCFGKRVAMLHSSLRMTERYDQWKRIRRGEISVVLGTRSAIFAPLKKLGLIILDEEQESSYQSENPPRYHARDVAKFRCGQDGAVLVLGSATPAVESAWAARQGVYHLELLRKRYNDRSLPQVMIADLRQEIRAGNAGTVSEVLRCELEKNLERGEQNILFLNRRGNSRMLLCGECGKVPECPRCSVPLTYHSANGRLMCHYCGHSERAFATCPDCGGIMKRVGTGTQKVEEELRELFPGIGVLRMDADTAAEGHEQILRKFETEKIPILLGTQMVTKGLDFENVTLVGVLCADLSLYVDHYRAAERTFSLLTQVVGRAGRGEKQGRAVIQTYTPGNDVIQSAAEQDYDRFYESEIRMRKIRRYPPFADLFTMTVSGTDEGAVLRSAVSVRDALRDLCADPEMRSGEPEVLGPAPAPVVRVNNRFRYRVLLVGRNDKVTREHLSRLLKAFGGQGGHRGVNLFIDCNAPE